MSAEDLRVARAELSRLVEPGDLLAGVLVAHLGAQDAHGLITSGAGAGAVLATEISERGEQEGLGQRQRHLPEGLARWRTRLGQIDGLRELATIGRMGGGLVTPEDPDWPAALEDLGPRAPLGLWYRSHRPDPEEALKSLPHFARRVAVVGSREVTDYGLRAASEIVEDLVTHGLCVVSGGAYGVDAAAHRAALRRHAASPSASVPTAAVLAGGLDRFYPAGNEQLLRSIAEHGVLLSEMPPGGSPTRHRFLQRNRLIAALTAVTVVIEARWCSGAQSTAHHALAMSRPVGVVPGSIYSASSAGCHRLLRETPAELVTDAADVVELIRATAAAESGDACLAAAPASEDHPRLPGVESPSGFRSEQQRARPQDGLREVDRLLLDALPRRRLSPPGRLAEVAGLPMPQVLGGLTRLQRGGLAREIGGEWGRAV